MDKTFHIIFGSLDDLADRAKAAMKKKRVGVIAKGKRTGGRGRGAAAAVVAPGRHRPCRHNGANTAAAAAALSV